MVLVYRGLLDACSGVINSQIFPSLEVLNVKPPRSGLLVHVDFEEEREVRQDIKVLGFPSEQLYVDLILRTENQPNFLIELLAVLCQILHHLSHLQVIFRPVELLR